MHSVKLSHGDILRVGSNVWDFESNKDMFKNILVTLVTNTVQLCTLESSLS